MEDGLGLTQVTSLVNDYLIQNGRTLNGKTHVGRSAVYNCHLRMGPVLTPILDEQQGSDSDLVWGYERLKWTLQLRVRYGIITGREATSKLWGVELPADLAAHEIVIPAYFDIANLTTITYNGTAHWVRSNTTTINLPYLENKNSKPSQLPLLEF